MKITEAQAIEIATVFANAEYQSNAFSLDFETASAKYDRNSPAVSFLKTKSAYWSVMFTFRNKDGSVATIDPNHVLIIVDAENGEAEWFEIM